MSDCGLPANVGSMERLGHDDEDFDDVPPASPRVTDAPKELWLNYGDIERDCTHRECYEAGEVTWCQDPVFGSDVKYVRADEADKLRSALVIAEAALADIGDADREPGDDLAWCESRAAKDLPAVRAALSGFVV